MGEKKHSILSKVFAIEAFLIANGGGYSKEDIQDKTFEMPEKIPEVKADENYMKELFEEKEKKP